MKILKSIKENKIFFVTFGVLMYTSFAYLVQKEAIHYVDNYYYPLYAVNYNCGYCSRLLIGTIFTSVFGENLGPDIILKVLLCIYFGVCFALSIFINNYLKKTKYEAIGIYSVFIALLPSSLAFLRYLGTLDLFFIPFVLCSLWLIDKKGWRWIVPVLCVVCLCIYDLFVSTYLPLMAIVIFYQFAKKTSVPNFIYVAVSAVIVGIATVYFLVIGDSTMKMTADQMVDFARNNLDTQGRNFDDLYFRSVFFWEVPDVEAYSGFVGYLRYNFNRFTLNDLSGLKNIIYFLISNTLSALPFLYLIAKAFRKAETPLRKLVFLCSFSPFVFMLGNLLLSTDTDRFSMHFFLVTVFLMLFFIKEKDTAFSNSYDESVAMIRENKAALAVFGISITRIVFSGVRF